MSGVSDRYRTLETAKALTRNGVSIIPIKANGSKAPVIKWRTYQSEIADTATLEKWFLTGYGVGIVAGEISGNLEVLDFDNRDAFKNWIVLVDKLGGMAVLDKLVLVATPNSGYHAYYRCPDGIEGNQKLATAQKSDGTLEVLIETRGEGGYTLAPGSPPECHLLNVDYRLVRGAFENIPTLSADERKLSFSCARALNEYVQPTRSFTESSQFNGGRPGDDFNASASWKDILGPHEWVEVGQKGEVTHWRRPGKRDLGISATTNVGGSGLLYVFSTNAQPFETERSYSRFAAYTLLNHEGDFSTAAAALAEKGHGSEAGKPSFASFSSLASGKWPDPLATEAFHGLAGEIVGTIKPHTEAHPAALLLQLLAAFGNIIGRKPYFPVEADRHYTNLYVVVVGETSKARKGTSWGYILRLFELVEPKWVLDQIQTGLSSGEGLIWEVRDPLKEVKLSKPKGGKLEVKQKVKDAGVSDKRLLVMESEFVSTLKVVRRDGNTLSPVIRVAWDTGNLNTLVKNEPAKATGAHISIVGHITREEILRYLDQTEACNGFANRYLIVCVRRAQLLPEGGNISGVDLGPLVAKLKESVEFSRTVEMIQFDEKARALWRKVYPELSEGKPGLLGAIIARAEAQVVRLACIYALLDMSLSIREEHLRAGLAVWKYCEDSCRYIFGDALGNPIADKLLRELRNRPEGMTRTDISNFFKRHRKSRELETVLDHLESLGLARGKKVETGGRPAVTWFATEHVKEAKEAK